MRQSDPAFPTARPVAATLLPTAGGREPVRRMVATEVPVNVVYAFQPYAVMMLSPADLEDFAVGFSLTEGVIGSLADIREVEVAPVEGGLRLRVDLVPERLHALLAQRRQRSMSGRTGCGLCGIEELEQLPLAARRAGGADPIVPAAIQHALAALAAAQVLNDATHSVHAAAWSDRHGEVLLVREDVGRHNALDKLIGALLRQAVDPTDGFVLITSRLSFEMVEKAAAFGAGTLVAISAPTSLAIDRARHHGMTLIAIARGDSCTVFVDAAVPVPPA